MLGRKQYLDQYYHQPLEKRQEFARKILKTVSIWSDKQDKAEVAQQIAKTIGIDPSLLDESKLNAIAGC